MRVELRDDLGMSRVQRDRDDWADRGGYSRVHLTFHAPPRNSICASARRAEWTSSA